jgi:hypothetical protein
MVEPCLLILDVRQSYITTKTADIYQVREDSKWVSISTRLILCFYCIYYALYLYQRAFKVLRATPTNTELKRAQKEVRLLSRCIQISCLDNSPLCTVDPDPTLQAGQFHSSRQPLFCANTRGANRRVSCRRHRVRMATKHHSIYTESPTRKQSKFGKLVMLV